MNAQSTRPVLLSGIQPTGNLTIGNYLGIIRNWIALQDQYDCLVFLADMCAITVRQEPADLLRRSYEFIALYLACGVDPAKNMIFVQSHVHEHAQLAWILNCFAYMGELERMTQFKDKAKRHQENINAGLFDYPVLMAADILLYRADLVPVGQDQKQHLELARNLAERFNGRFGPIFTVPEPYIPPVGSRIRSLLDPTKKMSKTDENPNTYIALLDDADTVRRKIKRAVTDPGSQIVHDESKPGIANLVEICSCVTGEEFDALEERYQHKGYAQFKADLAEVLIELLRPIQQRFRQIVEDKTHLAGILSRGAEAARTRARGLLEKIHDALGFIPA